MSKSTIECVIEKVVFIYQCCKSNGDQHHKIYTKLHSASTQKTAAFSLAAMKTSNPTH